MYSPATYDIDLLLDYLAPGEKQTEIDSGRRGAIGPLSSRIFFAVKGCRYIEGTKWP